MGLLKDIYTILKKEGILELLKNETIKFLKPKFSFSQPKITIGEKTADYKRIVSELTAPGLLEKFTDHFDYLKIIFGLIVSITFTKGKGCLLRDFFSEDRYIFYFPSPPNEPQMISKKNINNDLACYMKLNLEKNDRLFKQEDRYIFYIIDSSNVDFDILNEKLESFVREGKNEINECNKYLHNNHIQNREFVGISQKAKFHGFEFVSKDFSGESNKIMLNFKNSSLTKKIIQEDLNKLLDFKLIG